MKRKLAVVILLCLCLCSCGRAEKQTEEENMYGVWVATTNNLDFPSKPGLDAEQLKKEIDDICSLAARCDFNTLFLQVRANADSIYNNSVFGEAISIYGTRSPEHILNIDVLETFVQSAHSRGLKLYAWINPYRIGSGESDEVLAQLPKTHPAIQNDEMILKYSGGVALNPGVPMTTDLILQGIQEVAERYDIDGVVFDDYFYPYDGGYDDSDTYEKYGANFKTVGDFRRYSVNHMVQVCSAYLKSKNIPFGISPFAIWKNKSEDSAGSDTSGLSSYSEIYADSRLWVKKNWVDFISPQIYWSFENQKAGFEQVFSWWCGLCEKHDVKLYVSHYVSRIGSDLAGWEDSGQLARQLHRCKEETCCKGSVFFRIGDFRQNEYNEIECVKKYKY